MPDFLDNNDTVPEGGGGDFCCDCDESTIPVSHRPGVGCSPLDRLTVRPEGKYRVLDKIGEGGMKHVMQVNDRDTDRDLAMAVLRDDNEVKHACSGRFIREARLTANLEHPNIVPIHDIGVDREGFPYFTMKLVEGETLAKILAKTSKDVPGYAEKYTLQHLLKIFLSVCDAVDFAHAKGVIHLDLKPDNVQVGSYGEVLVLDWGLAKRTGPDGGLVVAAGGETDSEAGSEVWGGVGTDEDDGGETYVSLGANGSDLTMDGEIRGTPGFMAPEQAAGKNSERTTATDIYALGAILYTILAFRKPLDTKNLEEVLARTVKGDIIPVLEANETRKVPKPLAAVVGKAMSLDPADRYGSVRDLIRDVDAYLSGRVTQAEKASWFRRASLFVRRNKVPSALTLLAVVLAFLAAGMWMAFEARRAAGWGAGVDITPGDGVALQADWVQAAGVWECADGVVKAAASPDDAFILFWKKSVRGSVAVEFDAMVPTGQELSPSADLSAILSGDTRFPRKRGYFFQLGGLGNTCAIIQRRGGFLASVGLHLKAGKWYHVRVERDGPNLRLFQDGTLILAARDIFYLEGGFIGLYTFGRGKVFSNIKVFRKDVPRLVPPTVEGDAFVREALAAKSPGDKRRFLLLAKRAYGRVFESHPDIQLGCDALLKKAYVCRELGGRSDLLEAIRDILYLKKFSPTLDLFVLEGIIYFDGGDFAGALAAFSKAVRDYPDSSLSTTATLIGLLTKRKSQLICPEIRQAFWRLIATHHSSPALRCSSRALESLGFLKGLDFSLIDCSGNNIRSLEPIRGMRGLKEFDCADNKVESLEPLRGMELARLECNGNPALKDLSPLTGMPLESLSLHGCSGIESLKPLAGNKALRHLTIPKRLADDPVLKTLPNLESLELK